jgi:hypothetical protein
MASAKRKPGRHGGDYDDLLKAVKPLARNIRELQQKLKAMGGFAHDRELLECPKCRLQEDVTAGRDD